jgi:hypothetical protein
MRRLSRWLIATVGALLAFAVLSAAALADSSPVIEWTSAWNLTPTDATLGAGIDTNGLYTGYEFQIDTNASYDFTQFDCPFSLPGLVQCESITLGKPLPTGLVEPSPKYLPAGSGAQTASLDLASIGATLQPGTTYHYRVLASNGGQTVESPDRTFTTPPEGHAPVIESVAVTHLTKTDATLEAKIDTEGLETEYAFHLWSSPCSKKGDGCELVIPIKPPCGGQLLGSFVPQTVSLDLNSAGVVLGEGEYGFSVTARNEEGKATASGGVFEALEEPVAEPLHSTHGFPAGQPAASGGQTSGVPTPSSSTSAAAGSWSGAVMTDPVVPILGHPQTKPHKPKHKKHKPHKPHKVKAGRRR